MARIFISHSSHDNASSAELLAWLHQQGFEHAFLDIDESQGIPPGSRWEATLYEQMQRCQAVILVLTPHWFDSRWCFAEFVQARAAGKPIFPIIVAPCGERYVAGDIQQLDLLSDRDGGLRKLARELTRVALDAQGGFDWGGTRSPYPGMAAFEADDAAVFFGRDPEIRALIERLEARRVQGGDRVLALLGASGSGKSSLVRAGALPRLARDRQHWLVMPPMRPRGDPVRELAKVWASLRGESASWQVLAQQLAVADSAASVAALVDDTLARRGATDACLLVTIDQAEELFTLASPATCAAFGQLLTALAQRCPSALILVTMRSEMFGLWQAQQAVWPTADIFSLAPMPMQRIGEVVEGPARIAGLGVGPGLAAALAADAAGPDALPMIAFALRELFVATGGTAATRAPVITVDDYLRLGDSAGDLTPLESAVRKRADAVLDNLALDAETLAALRDAFVGALTNIDDEGRYTRRPAHWEELDAAVRPVLEAFVDARLLMSRQDGHDRIVEVAHEALLRKWPRLVAWLDAEADFLRGRLQLERARAEWAAAPAHQRDDALLQGLLLDRAHEWLARRPAGLSAAQRSYVEASVAHRDEQRRRARLRRLKVLSAISVLGVAVLGLGLFLVFAWRASQTLERDVAAQRLVRLSAASLDGGRADRALVQAAQAYHLYPDARTRSALLQAGIALSPHFDAGDRVANANAGAPSLASPPTAITALLWRPEPTTLLVGDATGDVVSISVPGAATSGARSNFAMPTAVTRDKNRPQTVLALQAGASQRVAAVHADGQLLAANAPGSATLEWQGPPLEAAALAPDERALTALTDGDRALLIVRCSSETAAPCRQQAVELPQPATSALAWDAGSSSAGVVLADGRLVLIDRETLSHRIFGRAANDAGAAMSLALQPGTQRWFIGDALGGLRWIDAATGASASQRVITPGAAPVTRLVWTADGRRLASVCDTQKVCLWDVAADGRPHLSAVMSGHQSAVSALAWSANGERLASADISARVMTWRADAAQGPARMLFDAEGSPLSDIAVHRDGSQLAASRVDGAWYVWSLPGRALVHRAEPRGELRALEWHPRWHWLALASVDQGTAIARLDQPGVPMQAVAQVDARIETLRWDAQGVTLFMGAQDGSVSSVATTDEAMRVAPLEVAAFGERQAEAVLALAVVPGNGAASATQLYSSDALGVVHSRGVVSGPVLDMAALTGSPVSIDALAFAPDGASWLAAGNHGDVFVFDRRTGKLRARLETGADMVVSAAFSPDGNMVAAIDNQERLHLWRAAGSFESMASVLLRARFGHMSSDRAFALGSLRRLVWMDGQRLAIATQSGLALLLSVSAADWELRAEGLHIAP